MGRTASDQFTEGLSMDIITEAIVSPFQYSFMVRALLVSVLVGIMCPVLGAYVVVRGLGFMSDGLAHSLLPGLVVATLAVSVISSEWIILVPNAIAFALLIGFLSKRTGLSEDTAIGILFAGLFALGLTMLTAVRGLNVTLEAVLLGQVLGVSRDDVMVTAALAVVVVVLMLALHKEMVFATFDPLGASVMGIPTQVLDYVLLVLLAVVILIALQAVGIVLVISMLITPAAAAQLLTQRFTLAMVVGAAIGVSSAVIGLYVSYHYNLSSGPVMALSATSFFIFALALKQGTTLVGGRMAREGV